MQQQETVTITMSVVTECVYRSFLDCLSLEISWSLWRISKGAVPQCSLARRLKTLPRRVAKSRFVKLEPQWLHIEPIFGMNWGLLLGTTILKEPGMEFPIEELSVCNTATNAGCTLRRQTENRESLHNKP